MVHVGRDSPLAPSSQVDDARAKPSAISAHDIPATSLKSSLCLSGPAGRDHQQQRYRQVHQPLGTGELDSQLRRHLAAASQLIGPKLVRSSVSSPTAHANHI